MFTLLFINLLLFVSAQDDSIITTGGSEQSVGISKKSPRFILDLEYAHAFDISIESKDIPFCTVAASKVDNRLKWVGEIDTDADVSFDNMLSHNNYFFALDSISLKIFAFTDINVKESVVIINSNYTNVRENGEFDETFFTLDEQNGILFVVTKKLLLSYPLDPFYKAVQDKTPIPDLSKSPQNTVKYTNIEVVRFYESNLYIVADNVVYIWFSAKNGDLAEVNLIFDANFLTASALTVTDIAFYKKYALLLDTINGVYAVDLKMAAQQIFSPAGLIIEIKKGDFIQVVQSTVNIIASTTKTTTLYEYVVTPNNTLTATYNRKQEIFQSVSDMIADQNYLYIITGFFNQIVRPGIPGKYDTSFIRDYISEFWPLYRADGMNIVSQGTNSQMLVSQGKEISLYIFESRNPSLICRVKNVPAGEYEVEIKVMETNCVKKQDSAKKDDFNTICLAEDYINLFISEEDVAIGNLSKTETTTKQLAVGMLALVFLVLVFGYLICKYRSNYSRLEQQFKFSQLKEVDEANNSNSEHNKPSKGTPRSLEIK